MILSPGISTFIFYPEYIFTNCFMLQSPKGQWPKSISYKTIPTDQTSALLPYTSPFNTSGAIQSGDPSEVCVKSSLFFNFLEKPKSANFRCPDLKNMLLGLTSLWSMLYQFKDLKALMICLNILRASLYGIFDLWRMKSSRVPSSQYQQTRQMQLLVLIISTKLITFILFYNSLRISISFLVSSVSLLSSQNFFKGIILTATFILVSMLVALYTFPYSPFPKQSVKVQLSIIFTIQFINKFIQITHISHPQINFIPRLVVFSKNYYNLSLMNTKNSKQLLDILHFLSDKYRTFFVEYGMSKQQINQKIISIVFRSLSIQQKKPQKIQEALNHILCNSKASVDKVMISIIKELDVEVTSLKMAKQQEERPTFQKLKMTNINYDQKVNNAESNFVKNPPAKRNGPNSGSQNESFQKNKPHFFQEIIMKEKKRMREMEEKKKKEREEALFVRSKCSAWQKYVPK